jgi:GH15 family glucan-1,4-alpha-glucosidase
VSGLTQGAQQLTDDTARFWCGWQERSSYTGQWREMVDRSAITLKMSTYANHLGL